MKCKLKPYRIAISYWPDWQSESLIVQSAFENVEQWDPSPAAHGSSNVCSFFGKFTLPTEGDDTFPMIQQNSGYTRLIMATLFIEAKNGKGQ